MQTYLILGNVFSLLSAICIESYIAADKKLQEITTENISSKQKDIIAERIEHISERKKQIPE